MGVRGSMRRVRIPDRIPSIHANSAASQAGRNRRNRAAVPESRMRDRQRAQNARLCRHPRAPEKARTVHIQKTASSAVPEATVSVRRIIRPNRESSRLGRSAGRACQGVRSVAAGLF